VLRVPHLSSPWSNLHPSWCPSPCIALLGTELSIPDAMFRQHIVHGLGTKPTEYLDMTSGESLFIARLKRGNQSWTKSFRSLRLKICKSKLR
jgi:hypothetical protein